MSKTACYENLYDVTGIIKRTGSKVNLRITGKDSEFWNVEN